MAEYGLKKSFDIDNGELDGMSPQQCFCLGYELAMIDSLAANEVSRMLFERPVHAVNQDRIRKSMKDAGLSFTLTYMENDVSESWMLLRSWEPTDGAKRA
jgi:hypothetical protein